MVVVQRIVADVGVKVGSGSANVQGHDIAQARLQAVALGQQIDPAEGGAGCGDKGSAHILLHDVEPLAADDNGLEQIAYGLVHHFNAEAIDLGHNVGRNADIHTLSPVDALDLVADVLVAGIDDGHTVAGIGGRRGIPGQETGIV